MFKIVEKPEFTHPVAVMVPVDGGHREETFKARFKVLSSDQEDAFDVTTSEGMKEYLRHIWVGFEDVADEAGNGLTWNDETRDRMLSTSYIRLALLRTYTAALVKVKAGN